MRARTLSFFIACLALLPLFANANEAGIWVDISATRSQTERDARVDEALRQFGKNAAGLTARQREALRKAGRFDNRIPFSFPMFVRLTQNGKPLPPPSLTRNGETNIQLVFDTTGPRAFPQQYRDLLQSVFNTARPTMNLVFGQPALGAQVRVRNYDADIGDRDAVAGGYLIQNNGQGEMEIRFPIYTSPEAAAVNFIHTLLLAYVGPIPYGFDAWMEGIVRAATMKVARTTGALPASLDRNLVESALENTYDVGSFYDWYNQRALSGPRFIAPNLRDVPLPPGGSLGGIYLLRYQMAGSAWQKALVENPNLIAEYNRLFYANPNVGNDIPSLLSIGQLALNNVKGQQNATIEGLPFAQWVRRQFILHTAETRGPKLLVQPIPISSGLAGPDFGVFDVSATYFETQAGGNEVLLSGTAYPIFWDKDFNRIFPSAQEDQMPIAGAYGSVTPNLPNFEAGQPYRAVVDIPVTDRIARAYLPAGAIATAQNPVENDFYGTVIGLTLPSGASARVRVTIGQQQHNVPIRNFAFGARLNTPEYLGEARLRVDVIRRQNNQDTVLLTRFVNKGPGPLALDLRINGDQTFTLPLLRGIQAIGFPLDPYTTGPSDLFGVPANQLLLGRYNANRAAYDLFPDTGPVVLGHGYFLRLNTAQPNFTVEGRAHPNTPTAVALRPGWNMITPPINETVSLTRVQVVRAADPPKFYAESVGVDLGSEFFTFQRGANDPASGAPEGGTMIQAQSFEPGKMYFVRVLAPEGVTMLFMPASTQPGPGRLPTYEGWHLRAVVNDGSSRAEAILGQTRTATPGFDTREDSLLPQGIGGLQVRILNDGELYRDIRRLNRRETYRLRIEGLVPGRQYTIGFALNHGHLSHFTLTDLTRGTVGSYVPSQPVGYSFRAVGTSHRIDVTVPGPRE